MALIQVKDTSERYANPAAARFHAYISNRAANGFVRNAIHPEASAASRTAGYSFPVM